MSRGRNLRHKILTNELAGAGIGGKNTSPRENGPDLGLSDAPTDKTEWRLKIIVSVRLNMGE